MISLELCVKTSQVSLGLKRVKTMVRVRGYSHNLN